MSVKIIEHPPSPQPSPPGEGESFAASLENLWLKLLGDFLCPNYVRRLFPLPGGEGQGEGGRND